MQFFWRIPASDNQEPPSLQFRLQHPRASGHLNWINKMLEEELHNWKDKIEKEGEKKKKLYNGGIRSF